MKSWFDALFKKPVMYLGRMYRASRTRRMVIFWHGLLCLLNLFVMGYLLLTLHPISWALIALNALASLINAYTVYRAARFLSWSNLFRPGVQEKLMNACTQGTPYTLEKLYQAHPKLNLNQKGYTSAAMENTSHRAMTPMDIAMESANAETVLWLLQKGAQIFTPSWADLQQAHDYLHTSIGTPEVRRHHQRLTHWAWTLGFESMIDTKHPAFSSLLELLYRRCPTPQDAMPSVLYLLLSHDAYFNDENSQAHSAYTHLKTLGAIDPKTWQADLTRAEKWIVPLFPVQGAVRGFLGELQADAERERLQALPSAQGMSSKPKRL